MGYEYKVANYRWEDLFLDLTCNTFLKHTWNVISPHRNGQEQCHININYDLQASKLPTKSGRNYLLKFLSIFQPNPA